MKYLAFSLLLVLNLLSSTSLFAKTYDYLDSEDVPFTEVYGHGLEAGFYFQVNHDFYFSKNFKKLDFNDEQLLTEFLVFNQPQLFFLNNTAQCQIFQGPYYKLDFITEDKFRITFSYLINTNAKLNNSFCKLNVKDNNNTTIKEIEYFTFIKDN